MRLRSTGLLEVSSLLSDPPCDRMVRLATRSQPSYPDRFCSLPSLPSRKPAARLPELRTHFPVAREENHSTTVISPVARVMNLARHAPAIGTHRMNRLHAPTLWLP